VTYDSTSGTETLRGVSRGKARLIAAASWLLGVVILLKSNPAWAQITTVNRVMQNVQTALTSVAVTLFTVAIMWAGFEMAFSHAQWSDVSNVVNRGILLGGAAGIATWVNQMRYRMHLIRFFILP
jgi:type IV secretion system protein VirB2